MSGDGAGLRFYTELAPWWPLVSPREEYGDDAALVAGLLATARRPVREVLELGSGGGHTASHLRGSFELTLVEAEEAMLAVSRALNPDCRHVRGDMRTVRLESSFDAILVHDAIDYMTTLEDLRLAFETAFAHCRPGGIAVFLPDDVAETFAESTESGGSDSPNGRALRYLAWSWDPDPADCTVRTEYVFVLREHDGTVRTVHEAHTCGLFPRRDWLRLLGDAGFEPAAVTEPDPGDRTPRTIFVGHRPPDAGGVQQTGVSHRARAVSGRRTRRP